MFNSTQSIKPFLVYQYTYYVFYFNMLYRRKLLPVVPTRLLMWGS